MSNVTTMESMFNGASSFSGDLTKWCVFNIPSLPPSFAPSLDILNTRFGAVVHRTFKVLT